MRPSRGFPVDSDDKILLPEVIELEGPKLEVICDKCRKRLNVTGILQERFKTPLTIEAHECAWAVRMGSIRMNTAHFDEATMDPLSFIAGLVGAQGFTLVPGTGR